MGSPMDLLGAGTYPISSIVCLNYYFILFIYLFIYLFFRGSKIGIGLKYKLYIDNYLQVFDFWRTHNYES